MNYKYLLLIFVIVIIFIGIAIWLQKFSGKTESKKPEVLTKKEPMSEKILSGKKIAMVVAFRDFRDEEYFVPKEILEKAGAEIRNVSNEKGTARGADGGEVEVDYQLSEIDMNDFDALVFIGGPGALTNLDNEQSFRLAKEAVEKEKLLSAICISPVILAKAGVLKGKKATVWSSPLDKSGIKILEENGASYQDRAVVIDGKIITANGPSSAKEFAEAIIEALK